MSSVHSGAGGAGGIGARGSAFWSAATYCRRFGMHAEIPADHGWSPNNRQSIPSYGDTEVLGVLIQFV